uniref:Ubiquitin carboxyl-terminal hydrolase n=1 Tax=Ornithodoros turicata TaxID=34597 RepID=A0A2R5LFQ0_9ACAR
MTQEDMQLISNPYVVGAARSADSLNKQVGSGIRKSVLESRIEFEEDNSRDRQWLDNVQGKYIQLNPGRNDRTVANGAVKLTERSPGLPVENGVKNGISPVRSRTSSPQKQGTAEDGIPRPRVRLHPVGAVTLEWRKMRRIGVGLLNAGNTCFLNSVLQCLSYCPPLANYLLDEDNHIAKCKSRMTFCMMCELQRHVKRALESSTTNPIRPAVIVENLRNIAKQFRHGSQEDAHEFLRYVVDHLTRSCINTYSGSIPLDRVSKETTVIHEIFGGYHRSQVTCLECKHTSNTYDLFMDFILDIKGAQSLTQALEKSVEPEILSGDNAYECPRCRKKVRAQKRFTVHRPPKVATIQFKRFDSMGHKVTRQMTYCDKLDLRPYMSDRQGAPLMYRLFGVLVHYGHTCNSGHYLCYVKNSNDSWYLMNDQQVHEVGLQKVLNQENAYLLFYVRHMPRENVVKKSAPLTLSNSPSVEPVRNGHIEPSWKKNLFQKSSSAPSSTPSSPSLTNGPSTAPAPQKPATPLPLNRSKISFGIRQPSDSPAASATHGTPVKRPAPVVTTPVKRPALGSTEGFTPSKSRLVPYTSNSSDTDDDRKTSSAATPQQVDGAESPKVKIGVSMWNVSAVKPPAASCQPPAGWNVTSTKEGGDPVRSEEAGSGDDRVPSESHNGTVEKRPFLASPAVERVRQGGGGDGSAPVSTPASGDQEDGVAGTASGCDTLPAPGVSRVPLQGAPSHWDENGGGSRWQGKGNLNGENGGGEPWVEKEPTWGPERQGNGECSFESGGEGNEEETRRSRGERFEKYIREGGNSFGQSSHAGGFRDNYMHHRGFHDGRGGGRISKRPNFRWKSGSQYRNHDKLRKMGFLVKNDGYQSRDDGRYGNSSNPFQEAHNFRNSGRHGGGGGGGYRQDSKSRYHKQNFNNHRRGGGHRYQRQMNRNHYSNWTV